MRCFQGYTLIEILVSLVIVALLASLAIPSYYSYVKVSHRMDAHTTLLNIQVLQEMWMNRTNEYTDDVTNLIGVDTSPEDHYSIRIAYVLAPINNYHCPSMRSPSSSPNKLVYTIMATPKAGGSQVDDTDCTCIYITSTGLKGSNSNRFTANALDCW
ncbi:MAG: prepilin-type N-terminal cleavage/methylation domain-containing protein [Endozoicomonadaceae bacterium]|nr:prepilin-type N-terminal cleavage/methylation domain-containing protein [Endozoicomonadaceae bacterium]